HNPDWAAYARACGADGYRVETYEELTAALEQALPRLAEGRVAVLDVAVAAVEPSHAQPGTVPARDERPLALAGAARTSS
ncbi:MAG TPA: thiamine pyrophosphate-dependent enzyme, partial [Limnochordales bacterium]